MVVATERNNIPVQAAKPAPVEHWGIGPDPVQLPKPVARGHPFRADVDMAELDDRARPGIAWAARTMSLSRSHLTLLSRRMSYPKRVMLVAVHLIDAKPTPLMGRVTECEYHADGVYRIVLELIPLPESEVLAQWFAGGGLK
jgi:hypothetical protein